MKRSYIGIAAVAILVAAVCIRAGFWQLDRLEQRRDRNSAIQAAGLLPALDLNHRLARELHEDPRPYLYRRLTARGTYLHDTEVLLRGRALEGMPGVHLVTALRTSPDDPPLPVLRGWMPAPDGASADPRSLRSGAIVTVHGMILPLVEGGEPRPVRIALEGDSLLTARSLDVSLLATLGGGTPPPLGLTSATRCSGSASPRSRSWAPCFSYSDDAEARVRGVHLASLQASRSPGERGRREVDSLPADVRESNRQEEDDGSIRQRVRPRSPGGLRLPVRGTIRPRVRRGIRPGPAGSRGTGRGAPTGGAGPARSRWIPGGSRHG
jgi:hypothetical protein